MATLNQIKVNTGTEANPTYVLHDVHDKRLDDGASSLVTTCTHLLATNAALSSFNPITSANLASVLGVSWVTSAKSGTTNIDDVSERCFFVVLSSNQSANPFPFTPDSNHRAFGFSSGDIIANRRFQVLMLESVANPKFYFRTKAPSDTSAQWSSWKEVATV